MKILWISYLGSWTKPLAEEIAKFNTIKVIIPSDKYEVYEEKNVSYYSIKYDMEEATCPMKRSSFDKINRIISHYKPDLIHVHGTEKNLAQVQKFVPKIPVVTSIQGILMGCLPFTTNYIDEKEIKKYRTLKNYLGFGGIRLMYKTCRKGLSFEEDILVNNKYFFGRTDFDKSHILIRNPKAHYFIGEEILRQDFYLNKNTWNIIECEKHSVFMPSGFNPIKGLHLAIEAVGLLKRFYPDVKLYIPGINGFDSKKNILLNPLRGEEYIRYSHSLIEKYALSENVVFLPRLNSAQMVEHMKKANVFVAPSSIDNSPNAVGEATMIGCPIVTTPVGGIPTFIKDGIHGLLSPAGDPYMLAYNIKRIFDDNQLALSLSENACSLALIRHDIKTVVQQYLSAYKIIINIHNGI